MNYKLFSYLCSRNSRDGGIGRHEGLTLPWPVMAVRVRVPLAALLLSLLFFSCGSKSGYFKLEGLFLHMNQGDFYVYSPDGVIQGIDTIHVVGGRFAYEIPCRQDGTLMIVFPNFSEQPIFAEPGASVSMRADASHMKEMTVEGTDANEDMNAFRKMIINASPPEVLQNAEMFIRDNTESPVCLYLIRNYFITPEKPNIQKALELVRLLPKDTQLNTLIQQLQAINTTAKGNTIPAFSATDMGGNKFTFKPTANNQQPTTVIYAWSSWNYQSQDLGRQLGRKLRQGANVRLIGISIDGTRAEAERIMKRDSITFTTVCDEKMFEGPLVQKLGITTVPANIVVGKNGRIIGRNLKTKDLIDHLQ